MKIKHWQGYGTVDAVKIQKSTGEGKTFIAIKVCGNHEWGVRCNDTYDISRWLLPKFSKAFKDGKKDYRNIVYLHLTDGCEFRDGEFYNTCLYEILFN